MTDSHIRHLFENPSTGKRWFEKTPPKDVHGQFETEIDKISFTLTQLHEKVLRSLREAGFSQNEILAAKNNITLAKQELEKLLSHLKYISGKWI